MIKRIQMKLNTIQRKKSNIAAFDMPNAVAVLILIWKTLVGIFNLP